MLAHELSNQILKSYYTVYHRLGYGFLEKVYENAMLIELKKNGLHAISQQKINVFYDERIVGEYYANLVVNQTVIIELKSTSQLTDAHEAQLINYLRSTRMEVGLLLNFGTKTEFRRKVFSNKRKSINP